MLDVCKTLLTNQFEAALCTLGKCIDGCPEANWNARVGNYAFCQVAFHTLFFADYYLGQNPDEFRRQPFHAEHTEFFRDYEELADHAPRNLYDRTAIQTYLAYCRQRALEVIASETTESLGARCGFPPKTFTRAELYVYNIRHIQHHVAQLSLRLRIDAGADIPWVGSGWRCDEQ
jgi:hypothetical protein